MEIVVKNLSYVYSEKTALSVKAIDDISLTINEGEFFGIVGHTGSGKSTFIQHFNGLIKIGSDKGSIKIGEFDLADKKCDFRKLRSKVGMVFQYPEQQLFAETVEEDVAFGLKNFMPEISEIEKNSLVRSAIEMVGLDYKAVKGKSPFELSGGQRRRVAIAGVIVTNPEILILDEPAVGLDPTGRKDFIELLHRLHKTSIKTIVLVSHDMDLVAENCTKIAIFSEGKLFAEGTPKEIFSNYKIIEEAQLDLPVTAYLTKMLSEKGILVDSNLKIDDFVSKFMQAKKDGVK